MKECDILRKEVKTYHVSSNIFSGSQDPGSTALVFSDAILRDSQQNNTRINCNDLFHFEQYFSSDLQKSCVNYLNKK